MNKQELVAAIAARTESTKKEAEAFVNAFVDVVEETLTGGDKVQLIGFGTFETRERAARTARNPQTGDPIEIAATKVPAFKAGNKLKDSVK